MFSNSWRWQMRTKFCTAAVRPRGLVGRGSGLDLGRVSEMRAWRWGEGFVGRGPSHQGQRVEGSTLGSMKPRIYVRWYLVKI